MTIFEKNESSYGCVLALATCIHACNNGFWTFGQSGQYGRYDYRGHIVWVIALVDEEIRAKVLEMSAAGMSVRQIAQKLPICKSSVWNIIKKTRQDESATSTNHKRTSHESKESQMKEDLPSESLLPSDR